MKKALYARKIMKNQSCGRELTRYKHTSTRHRRNSPDTIIIDKEPPGKGFRHFLHKKTIRAFIELLPDWNTLSQGLQAIFLAKGESGCDGWYTGSIVAISAWERDMWRLVPPDYFLGHKHVLFRLGVECCKQGGYYLCKFTPASIRAFQLLHVFLHELGHHYDKITTRTMREASRGESFAERYAVQNENDIWEKYIERFGL